MQQHDDRVRLSDISGQGAQAAVKSGGPNRPSKKKKSKAGVVFLVMLLILALLAGSLAVWGILFMREINGLIDRQELDYNNLGIDPKFDDAKYDGVTNIILLGLDGRNTKACRSDVMMIITVDKNTGTLKATSLLRDTAVKIEGKSGTEKLNHAYAYGRAQLAIKTINQSFDLNIKDYIAVDFDSMAKVVDVIGPVEIDVKENELASANNSIKEYASVYKVANPTLIEKAGLQELNGMQACGYSRVRKDGVTGGDSVRTDRQRLVVEKVFENLKKTSLFDLPDVARELAPIVETSMDSEEALKLAFSVLVGKKAEFSEMKFPLDADSKGQMVSGMSVKVYDKEATVDKLHKYLFENIKPE